MYRFKSPSTGEVLESASVADVTEAAHAEALATGKTVRVYKHYEMENRWLYFAQVTPADARATARARA